MAGSPHALGRICILNMTGIVVVDAQIRHQLEEGEGLSPLLATGSKSFV